MKDFLGKDIQVGDTVAFMAPQYRHMVRGIVIDLTPQKIIIEYNNNWNYGNNPQTLTFLATPFQVMKIDV